jgi:hypothetical protein
MALVVVEHVLDSTGHISELQREQAAASWRFAAPGVRPLRSFFALDRRHIVSLYDAPNPESVRESQRAAPLKVERAWPATAVIDTEIEPPKGYPLVVAQRALPEGLTLEQIQYAATDPTGCGRRMRLHQIGGFLALDCRRMCCAYYAPDLDSVRVANREAGIPIERLWSAELIRASA